VAGVGATGPATASSASPGAGETAPLFGGFRGGRKRKDGLAPGSPEALAADREKDRLRKERQRDRQRGPDPAPLPSVAGAPAAAPGALGADPGLEGAPVLPWEAKMLEPLFEQLLPAVEELSVNQIASRATKARLPVEMVREIETDAKWSTPAKKALEIAGPQVAAKWLNKTGISAENQPEVVLGTAVASILAGHVLLLRRLDKLIAVANAPTARPAPEAPKA